MVKYPRVVVTVVLVSLMAIGLSFPSGGGLAQEPIRTNINAQGVAVDGHDLVSYFTEDGPKKGNDRYAQSYKGVTYYFASMENRDRFKESPEKYLPAFGGFCSYGVVMGKKYKISPDAWRIVNDVLYFELNKGTRKIWEANRDKHIEIGNRIWPAIENIPANKL